MVDRYVDIRESQRLRLVRPAVPASVGELRTALARFARTAGASDAVCEAVALAVSEATTNVVQHAYCENAGLITVSACAGRSEMTITVADRGQGVRLASESPGLRLGLALIAQSADRVDLRTRSRGGLAVRMTFTLSR